VVGGCAANPALSFHCSVGLLQSEQCLKIFFTKQDGVPLQVITVLFPVKDILLLHKIMLVGCCGRSSSVVSSQVPE